MDVGCGTGDLLFKASKKIRFGLGVDLDRDMIVFANKKKQRVNVDNLEFIQTNVAVLKQIPDYDIDLATSTLCLHAMKESDALSTLKVLAENSSRIVIADYSTPKSYWSKISMEIDEVISGHYGRFREYRRNGGIPYLAKMTGLTVSAVKETPVDGILIWELCG